MIDLPPVMPVQRLVLGPSGIIPARSRAVFGTIAGQVACFVGVTLVASLLYVGLQGELPYHDAVRFIGQVESGAPVWDMAHFLLQPTALLLTWLSGAPAEAVLKGLSSLATAVAVGLFAVILVRRGYGWRECVMGTVLLAGCCSVLTLAPSAHPKLVAFPLINAALLALSETEPGRVAGRRRLVLLVTGGVLLAVAGGFLASALATVPFVALAAMVQERRRGQAWWRAAALGGAVAAAAGAAFLLLIAVSFPLIAGRGLSVEGLFGSLAEKAALRPPPSGLLVQAARAVFGTVNNMVTVQEVGATVQAWLGGQVPSLQPYWGLLPGLLVMAGCGAVIAAVYGLTAMLMVRRRCFPMPVAFLCGAQAWSIWYGLNDPEHWFQLSAPTIILFLMVMPRWSMRPLLAGGATAVVAINLALLSIPVARYPLHQSQAALARTLRPGDVLVSFAAYPGRPYVGFMELPEVVRERIDTMASQAGSAAALLAQVDADVAQALRAGRRVVVADVLDERDWEAPWMSLSGRGLTKARVYGALLQGRSARRVDDVGGIKLWELVPAPGPGAVAEAD